MLRRHLTGQGYDVIEAGDVRGATEAFEHQQPDLALLDHRLPDGDALDLLARFKKIDPEIPLIVLTGHGSIDLSVRAVKLGAEQFFTKPIQLSALSAVLKRSLENLRSRRRQQAHKASVPRLRPDPFLGRSPAIRELAEMARMVVDTDSPVLLLGETGTGKGVLARWLHAHGRRKSEPLVDVNCAGLSREFLESELFGHERGAFTGAVSRKLGLCELAHRGSLFLDEIGDLSLELQPRVLKVVEEKKFRRVGGVREQNVDIRLMAASHHDLLELTAAGRFRQDLLFRINALTLVMPPLRQRPEDILPIARHLLTHLAQDLAVGEIELSDDAARELRAYSWPGNIRELRNVLERVLILGRQRVVDAAQLHRALQKTPQDCRGYDSHMSLAEVEHFHIAAVLHEEEYRVARAAERLGMPRSTLYQKIKKLGLGRPRGSAPPSPLAPRS